MKFVASLWVCLALWNFSSDKALSWGREGHEVVASIAERLLTPAARSKITKVLVAGGYQDLASIACWADELVWAARGEGPLSGNQEALQFNAKFPNNRTWHFVNLPLGTTSYQQLPRFTSPDDVVHAVDRCIRALEKRGRAANSPARKTAADRSTANASPGDHKELTELEALRLLVHFVGDLHQPLHCGTGYYSFDAKGAAQLISFPEDALGKPNDRGGNLLFYGSIPTEQLHALWDHVLVQKIDEAADSQILGDFLVKHYLRPEMFHTPGDHHSWAEAWAVDSARIATLAYLGISIGKAKFDFEKNPIAIEITLPASYVKTNIPYAARQLTLAGARLARLLNIVFAD